MGSVRKQSDTARSQALAFSWRTHAGRPACSTARGRYRVDRPCRPHPRGRHSATRPSNAAVGAIMLEEAMRRFPEVDGIACSNDHLALGVLFECQRMDIEIPERLAVVGFVDLSFSSASNPALTTIKPPGALIGTEAARMIIERTAGKSVLRGRQIHTRFNQRQTS
nr:substrate-binding domain-containing protein [Ensifer adhaerens]